MIKSKVNNPFFIFIVSIREQATGDDSTKSMFNNIRLFMKSNIVAIIKYV
jgi:hypothetical protein